MGQQALDIVRDQIVRLGLDLSGLVVVAGAAAGYQAVVATAAALAATPMNAGWRWSG